MSEINNEEEIRRIIGERIRAERLRRGWIQAVLAEKTDVSVRLISMIEKGEVNTTLTRLTGIANALDMNVFDLLTGTDTIPFIHQYYKLTERDRKLLRMIMEDMSEL